nr:phosphoribosylanthranilate isomerase [Tessaracoccus sp. MC1756]
MCGVTQADEVIMCAAAGADALGFVVDYPADVPWNLTLAEAVALFAVVPVGVERVLVAGDDPAAVLSLAEALRPDAVQLHADEGPETTRSLAADLHGMGIRILKALRFSVESGGVITDHDVPQDPVAAAQHMVRLGVDALLVDSISSTQVAGTGRTVDLAVARSIRDAVAVPVILAGGLAPGNVAEAIRLVRPHGVDVISGVEARRRVKDPAKVTAFTAAVHGVGDAPTG